VKVVGAPGKRKNAFCGDSFGRMTAGGGAGAWLPRVSGQPADLEAARLHTFPSPCLLSPLLTGGGVMLGMLAFA
jgi:hypothetical protein